MEATIDQDRPAQPVVQQDGLVEQLQQHLVEPLHLDRRAVVVLHELFDRQVGVGIAVAQLLRQYALVFEKQTVFMAVGEQMECIPDPPEMFLALAKTLILLVGQEAPTDQCLHAADVEMALGHPGDRLDVTQPAWTLLEVGLEVLTGIVVLGVAFALLLDLGGIEFAARPDVAGPRCLDHVIEEPGIPGQQP